MGFWIDDFLIALVYAKVCAQNFSRCYTIYTLGMWIYKSFFISLKRIQTYLPLLRLLLDWHALELEP